MKSLNDLIWTNEDDDIITTQGVMTKPCKINDDCSGGSTGPGMSIDCFPTERGDHCYFQ